MGQRTRRRSGLHRDVAVSLRPPSDKVRELNAFFRSNWFPIVLEVLVAAAWTAFLLILFGAESPYENITFYLSGPLALAVTVVSIRNVVLRKHRLWVAISSVVLGLALCVYVFVEGFEVMVISSI
jgi:hypothetical protein